MTMYEALCPKDDTDWLYVSRKGGIWLASFEDSVDASIQRLEDNIEKRGEGLIIATGNNTDNTKTNKTTITRKQKWEEKKTLWTFKRLISNISHENMDVPRPCWGTEETVEHESDNYIICDWSFWYCHEKDY